MVAFPLEVRHNYYCVSTSQRQILVIEQSLNLGAAV